MVRKKASTVFVVEKPTVRESDSVIDPNIHRTLSLLVHWICMPVSEIQLTLLFCRQQNATSLVDVEQITELGFNIIAYS